MLPGSFRHIPDEQVEDASRVIAAVYSLLGGDCHYARQLETVPWACSCPPPSPPPFDTDRVNSPEPSLAGSCRVVVSELDRKWKVY